MTTNSPSPSMKATKISFQSYESSEIDMVGTTKYKAEQGSGAEEYPSTRTSKDNKDSPTLHSKQKSPRGGHTNKVGFSLNDEKFAEQRNIAEEGDYDIAQDSNPKARVKVDANYIDSFKAMMGGSASASGLFKAKLNGSVQDMSSAAGGGGGGAGGGAGSASTLSPHGGIDPLGILPPKKRTAEDDRENAERVDALLMELFPERFEGKKAGKKGGKGIKKAAAGSASGGGAGYSKNQVSSCTSCF